MSARASRTARSKHAAFTASSESMWRQAAGLGVSARVISWSDSLRLALTHNSRQMYRLESRDGVRRRAGGLLEATAKRSDSAARDGQGVNKQQQKLSRLSETDDSVVRSRVVKEGRRAPLASDPGAAFLASAAESVQSRLTSSVRPASLPDAPVTDRKKIGISSRARMHVVDLPQPCTPGTRSSSCRSRMAEKSRQTLSRAGFDQQAFGVQEDSSQRPEVPLPADLTLERGKSSTTPITPSFAGVTNQWSSSKLRPLSTVGAGQRPPVSSIKTPGVVTCDVTFKMTNGVVPKSVSPTWKDGRVLEGQKSRLYWDAQLEPSQHLPIVHPHGSQQSIKNDLELHDHGETDDFNLTQKGFSTSETNVLCSEFTTKLEQETVPASHKMVVEERCTKDRYKGTKSKGMEHRGTKKDEAREEGEGRFSRDWGPASLCLTSEKAAGYPWLTWSSVIHPDQPDLQPTAQQRLAAAQDPSYILHLVLQVEDLIGQGQYGKVYAATLRNSTCTNGQRRFALKKITKSGEETKVHTLAEHRALAAGLSCPFIIQLVSCFQTKLAFFLLMELAEGGRLTDVLTRFGRLPEVNVRFYAAQIFLALSFLHEQNILHRDLKLDNVLLDGAGFIRLCDFGLSVDGFQDDGLATSPCGTFVYVAPEVFRNSYGKAADWWSYGVLLYLMATGRLPFGGKNIKELFVAITRKEPFYDSFLSSALVSLLKRHTKFIDPGEITPRTFTKKLLSKSACDRPGHKSSGDKRPLTADPFFAGVDWFRLQAHLMTPPPLPKRRLQTSRPSENLSSAASHAFLSASFPAAQSLSSPLERDWLSKTTRSGSLSMTGLPAV